MPPQFLNSLDECKPGEDLRPLLLQAMQKRQGMGGLVYALSEMSSGIPNGWLVTRYDYSHKHASPGAISNHVQQHYCTPDTTEDQLKGIEK